MADWLRSRKRFLASEVDDLLRRVAGTAKVDLFGESAVSDLGEWLLSERFPLN